MEELISKKYLYDKAVALEQKALSDLKEETATDNLENWVGVNVSLMERTAFKHDVMDAPTIIEMPDTGIGDLSDGYHTFNQLYYQRMMLFATIVRQNKDKAWKSHKHEDGELCFGGGWFIVGVDTPEGSYTYHYEDKYWDYFDCMELDVASHWDGHTEEDVTRLLSLPQKRVARWVVGKWTDDDVRYNDTSYKCNLCGGVSGVASNYCPSCGAEMVG